MNEWALGTLERKGEKTGENHDTIMTNGLALSPFADFGKRRIREKVFSPAELVVIDIEGDSRGDWLTREARGARWFGSLTTPRTRSRSAG